tara:strand:+ start:303 stop:467 length:165 start_codon:yes stop_codon:yes gene_type:complete
MGTFTVATGFGLLAVGLVVIAIAATIFFTIVNKMEKDKKEQEKIKQWEKKYGSR